MALEIGFIKIDLTTLNEVVQILACYETATLIQHLYVKLS